VIVGFSRGVLLHGLSSNIYQVVVGKCQTKRPCVRLGVCVCVRACTRARVVCVRVHVCVRMAKVAYSNISL
jgi:hypothetical protein